MASHPFHRPSVRYGNTPEPVTPYQKAQQVWDERMGSARVQASNWRIAALAATALSTVLGLTLTALIGRSSVVPYVVEVDRLGGKERVARRIRGTEIDRRIEIGGIGADAADNRNGSPIVGRQRVDVDRVVP